VDTAITTPVRGFPIVGDFDGDGRDDIGAWQSGVFAFDLANNGFGQQDATIAFNFIGARLRPVAADMDQDGIDDIGLWVPDRSGMIPADTGEWFFLISNDFTDHAATLGSVQTLNHRFTPVPFGSDISARFGDEFAVPLVGNFDPPVAGSGVVIDGVASPAPFVVSPGDWTDEGLTVKVGSDGLLHVYHTGTTTDAVPPRKLDLVTGLYISGRGNAADVLTIDTGNGNPIPPGGFSYMDGGRLIKTGPGTADLSLPNNYQGDTVVQSGVLRVGDLSALPVGGNLVIGAGSTLVLSAGLSDAGAQAVASAVSSATVAVVADAALPKSGLPVAVPGSSAPATVALPPAAAVQAKSHDAVLRAGPARRPAADLSWLSWANQWQNSAKKPASTAAAVDEAILRYWR
jgi:autotransporter-associated beta strand protein